MYKHDVIKSVEKILGECHSHYNFEFDDGVVEYSYDWNRIRGVDFDIAFWEPPEHPDDNMITLHSREGGIYLEGIEIHSFTDCTTEQILKIAQDFIDDKITLPYNTNPDASVVCRSWTGKQYENGEYPHVN